MMVKRFTKIVLTSGVDGVPYDVQGIDTFMAILPTTAL